MLKELCGSGDCSVISYGTFTLHGPGSGVVSGVVSGMGPGTVGYYIYIYYRAVHTVPGPGAGSDP